MEYTSTTQTTTTERDIYSVSRLNQEARDLLEHHFSTIWIQGELSNFAHPRSGHMYFSLKDDNTIPISNAHTPMDTLTRTQHTQHTRQVASTLESAQVRCAMFKMANRLINFEPQNGMQVLARARVSLYPERGEFQLIVDYLFICR